MPVTMHTVCAIIYAQPAQDHGADLYCVTAGLQLGGVFLVCPMSSCTVLSHFVHVGSPDLDLHGDPPWTLHCSVQGLVPRPLGVDDVVIILAAHLAPQPMDCWLNSACTQSVR